jgi:Ni/Fe-hydrogenase b-type cytochrome subunit
LEIATKQENAEMADETRVFRHRLSTRVWHWVNVVATTVMIMSGLMISNAHPRLYWGEYGANGDAAWLELPHFPGWATIPSTYNLAIARNWHLAFAWILAFGFLFYCVRSLWNGHFRRDIAMKRAEVMPSHLWQDIKQHAKLNFHTDGGYNPLQKITYSLVLFVLMPGMIFTGLTLSPGMNAAWPWLLDVFGGRQSARSIHFICTFGLVVFIAVHLLLVLLAGPVNEVRSMITGWFMISKRREP